MARPCRTCGAEGTCVPDCPTLFWPDGRRRGDNPGRPPGRSLTLQDELGLIFKGLAESAIAQHLEDMAQLEEV